MRKLETSLRYVPLSTFKIFCGTYNIRLSRHNTKLCKAKEMWFKIIILHFDVST